MKPLPRPDWRGELQRVFGYPEFRPGQEEVIETLWNGRSALAIFPTGGGKSLCYQLPALHFPGLTLVVSPLLALMKDQVDALVARGVAAERLDSTLSAAETSTVLDRLGNGTCRLLYIAPERFLSEAFLSRLGRREIDLLAIDEAHCISEWGHNFRPEYLRLADMAPRLGVRRVLALTATATPAVADAIRASFGITPTDQVQTSFHRPNLFLRITPVSAENRLSLLTQRLTCERPFPAIVYVTLQHTAESVAAHLQRSGVRARAYHAGLNHETRTGTQEDFMTGKVEVIVATIAFGMGIDKADIRSVFHYNLPKTLENYQQEIGRAGRDGAPSVCEVLACGDDRSVLENFPLGDTPSTGALQQCVDSLLRQGAEFDISRYELSRSTDIRPLVLETVLTYLEKDGLLAPAGSFYSTYQLILAQSEERILAGHTPDRQQFLRSLLAAGKRGRKWITLEPAAVALQIREPEERIHRALRYLEEMGDIEIKPSGLRHRFRLQPAAASVSPVAVSSALHARFLQREQQDLARLDAVVHFCEGEGCLTERLLHYFGEELASPCGHCSICQGESPQPLPCSPPREITLDERHTIDGLRRENHAALRSPRALARFLCGLSSPATTRDRLQRHELFGLLEGVPFAEVLALLESQPG